MNYCIDPSADEPIMLINKHIGFDETEGMGVEGGAFQLELLQLDSLKKKRIQVWINSTGGIVTDGYNIYSAILKSKTPVDTYCMGAAASIAGVIFQAGRKRIMADYAWLMYHNPFGSTNDAVIKTMRESIISMIETRCGMTEKQVSDMMNRTTFIQSDEALQMKLCDEIESSVEMNTKYLRKVTDQLSFHNECNKVVNSIINQNLNSNTMLTKVTMRLKLNDAATEDNIVKAIDAIEDRAKKAEEDKADVENKAANKAKADGDEVDKLKAALAKAKEEHEKAKAAFEDCKQKLDAMETDKLAAENAAKEEKVKNMVERFAKAGRIKNDATTVLQWTTTAKALGFDEVKNMIEGLPLNKDAVKITDADPLKLEKGVMATSATNLAVMNKLRREGKLK